MYYLEYCNSPICRCIIGKYLESTWRITKTTSIQGDFVFTAAHSIVNISYQAITNQWPSRRKSLRLFNFIARRWTWAQFNRRALMPKSQTEPIVSRHDFELHFTRRSIYWQHPHHTDLSFMYQSHDEAFVDSFPITLFKLGPDGSVMANHTITPRGQEMFLWDPYSRGEHFHNQRIILLVTSRTSRVTKAPLSVRDYNRYQLFLIIKLALDARHTIYTTYKQVQWTD